MKGFRDLQEYAPLVTNVKEKKVIMKLQHKIETMLGYRTDKMMLEDKMDASYKQR